MIAVKEQYMDEIKKLIRSKLEYDKEVYDKNTYSREYRSIKLLKICDKYKDIHVGFKGIVNNDMLENGTDKHLYGAEWESLPEEIFVFIDQLKEYQSVCLHLFYPEIIREVCFRQNIYFLSVISLRMFTPQILENVFLIVPLYYVMRFGNAKANNRIQVMFYFRSYTHDHASYRQKSEGKCFFIDNIPIKELKKSDCRNKAICEYVANLQKTLFESNDNNEFFRGLTNFSACFKQITIHGT